MLGLVGNAAEAYPPVEGLMVPAKFAESAGRLRGFAGAAGQKIKKSLEPVIETGHQLGSTIEKSIPPNATDLYAPLKALPKSKEPAAGKLELPALFDAIEDAQDKLIDFSTLPKVVWEQLANHLHRPDVKERLTQLALLMKEDLGLFGLEPDELAIQKKNYKFLTDLLAGEL